MPRKAKYETVRCHFYEWRLIQRKENQIWYADARTTSKNRGRHSLETCDKDETMARLVELDRMFAEERGLTEPSDRVEDYSPLPIRNALVREVITPLTELFPKQFENERSFEDGRLHSFRHYFCSVCANTGIPERITMNWLGHADSEMVRHYYHLNDEESRRKMDQLNLLGGSDGRSVTDDEQPLNEE